MRLEDYQWTWVPSHDGARLVGFPARPVDPRALVLRHVTLDELAELFGVGDEELDQTVSGPVSPRSSPAGDQRQREK